MENKLDLNEILDFLDPSELSREEWLFCGMALKQDGYPVSDWTAWSRRDPARFHDGECERLWDGFHGSPSPVTGGTIVQMAKDRGWRPVYEDYELDWDSVIGGREEGVVIRDPGWIEGRELQEPAQWDPVGEIVRYLETLFDSTDNVGYVTKSFERDGRYMPTKGNWDRTAGELIEELNKCGGDLSLVFGDYNPEVGAWIRFNPLDGSGCKNANVTDFRFTLVESDHMELEQQNALIRELELPVAALVYSGGKSVHAIVRIEAASYEEYRKRVDYLYAVLKKNGMDVDTQNKNPSRLSRMPGVTRGEHKQFLIDTNLGKASWNEWKEWIEASTDDLPEFQNILEFWKNPPTLAQELIPGILRKGRKMMIVGASKTGKSMLLSELAIAIAEGKPWLGRQCAQGKVLYVNLEIPEDTFGNRIIDIYNCQGLTPNGNLTVWNLRGYATQMDKLTPKLVRRAKKLLPDVVIIDPIYKVLTGDENSAEQMARFCNEFDKVCTQLKASTIYCHHHSKGAQGSKNSMDRASGSGVFARDADALIDLTQVKTTLENKEAGVVAMRVEGVLREFPALQPFTVLFKYPIHVIDDEEQGRPKAEGANAGGQERLQEEADELDEKNWRSRFAFAVDCLCAFENTDSVPAKDLEEFMSRSESTIKNYVNKMPDTFERVNGRIRRKGSGQADN